jgi:hypothetical protein
MMRRRAFIGSCASAAALAAVAPRMATAQPPSGGGTRAILALKAARQNEVRGNFEALRKSYHSDAIHVEPASLQPNIGRAAITETLSKERPARRLSYFYYRQPEAIVVGSAAIVVSNYEAGYELEGKPAEETGKSTSVVLLGPSQPVIAQDVMVPNIYAGGYGPRGTALTAPRFGLFPLRVLGPEPVSAKTAGGGENDVIFKQVQKINSAWVSGKAEDLLRYANRSGVFLVGDYSPYYIAGADEVKRHFADFYETSSVKFVREVDPQVRIWGDVAAVAFNFDLDYTINGNSRRSPGRAVYTFTRNGAPGVQWAMAACAASHLVVRDIGDPYPFT